MSSPPSNSSQSAAFERLHPEIQKWIWEQGWTVFRDAQERATPLLLDGNRDLIISASTASGKTEAAFLPILTRIVGGTTPGLALYVSPLKALINDQWDRLQVLCKRLDLPVTPWHGDIAGSRKVAFLKRPQGCLLITPESLEGILMRYGTQLASVLAHLQFIVVDELHAFFGTERGRQLQSLLHRMDLVRDSPVQRIGLSATLGDMVGARAFLRPGDPDRVDLIESNEGQCELQVLVREYLADPVEAEKAQEQELSAPAELQVGKELYRVLRGSHNLVFANSRRRVETFADMLRRQCESDGLPNEFWPHHGSLSKLVREETEAALKDKARPSTAVATSTLELGINIGAVKAVAQIEAAPSVASLRQRLGRSGRLAGQPQILRGFCIENGIDADSEVSDRLHEGLLQMAAQVCLLIQGWYEPPASATLQLSTLIQQLLSLIAQYGGVKAVQAWTVLCSSELFTGLSQRDFAVLLRELGDRKVLTQAEGGVLLLGQVGEEIVNRYDFLAAFTTVEEFQVISDGRPLGALPVDRPLVPGSYIILAGRRWQVIDCRMRERIIQVTPAAAGRAPMFSGLGGRVHGHVREQMRAILSSTDPLSFLDSAARDSLNSARQVYRSLKLDSQYILPWGDVMLVLPWDSDSAHDTIAAWLRRRDLEASNEGIVIRVQTRNTDKLHDALLDLAEAPSITEAELVPAGDVPIQEKWEWLLPEPLLRRQYVSRVFDIPAAVGAVRRVSSVKG
jgi:ATP-dependent helicase Lhr and Lhr-like helicase